MDYSNFQDNKSLRTHKRLDDIINEYNGYIESLEKEQQSFNQVTSPSGAPGSVEYKPQYKYYHFQVFAFSWLSQVKAAFEMDDDYAKTKIKMARFFFRHVYPEMDAHAAMVLNGKDASLSHR